MAFEKLPDLSAEKAISLGGTDRKTGKANPTQVVGHYIGSKNVESSKARSGYCKLHFFSTAKGNLGVWGKTDLDRQLAQVKPGYLVRATFVGMKKTKNNDMYKFSVEVDKDNAIEVSSVVPSDNDEATDYTDGSNYESSTEAYEPESSADEDYAADEAPPTRPKAPARPAATPDASRAAKVRELLGSKNKAS